MSLLEPDAHGPRPAQNGRTPLPATAGAEPTSALRAALLDPVLWRERLGEFARATDLAVALTDEQGRLLGEYILPQPSWSRSSSPRPTAIDGCPFSPETLRPCSCVRDALNGCRVVVREGTGPVHFAVALSLGDRPMGVLLAGQVLDQPPERRPREHATTRLGLSLDGVPQSDRRGHPVQQATLQVYAELLGTLGQMILETRHHAFREAERLEEMTRLRDRAMTEVAERRRVEERQRFLLGVSDEFDSRDYETTLKRLARRAVPFLADFCFVDVVADDETIRRVGWAHADPAKRGLFDAIDHFVPPRDGQDDPVSRVLREGQADFVPEVTDAWMRAAATSPQHLELMRELELRSLMTVPLMARERWLGAFTFCYAESSGRRYTAGDLHLAEDLAHRAAMVVENAGLYRALQESDRRKDEFLAVLGHELRSPLAPIHSAIQVLRARVPADPELQWTTAVLEHQVEQITRLVDDLLDVSRIGQGKIHLRRELVDLADVVARAVESSRPLIEARKQHLEVSLPERAVEVEGDLLRLVQVVSNLLNNAAKYTGEGGRIALSVEDDGDRAILRVRDTGIGIAAAMLQRIFDPFTQVPGQVERSQGGLGIGLGLVRSLIHLHGGSVQATSVGPGRGSEFVVQLPLFRRGPPPAPAAAKETEVAAKGPSRRILVIDDNRQSADTMAMLLRVFGHEVWTAYDGPTALDLARLQPPEVVLCDIGLPGMSGLEVARRLRLDLGLRDVLLVALTGYGQEEDMRRSQEAGFNAHMVKPIGLDALHAMLSRAASPAPRPA
jgi:signal transduction histidine kinase/ActR/RegA family two-component response regulator